MLPVRVRSFAEFVDCALWVCRSFISSSGMEDNAINSDTPGHSTVLFEQSTRRPDGDDWLIDFIAEQTHTLELSSPVKPAKILDDSPVPLVPRSSWHRPRR